MSYPIQEELFAQAIGCEVMRHLKEEGRLEALFSGNESKALEALEEICRVLGDETLDDPLCFQHIEAIVNVLEAHGIFTTRHDG